MLSQSTVRRTIKVPKCDRWRPIRLLAVVLGLALPRAAAADDPRTAPADGGKSHECLIEPRQVLKLAAAVQGVVASVAVDRGDRVHKGQIVARLESELEETGAQIARLHAANDSAVRSARARLDFLKRKQARDEQLHVTDAVSFAQMDEATADARVAEAQLLEAELNLATARLEARRADEQTQQRRVVSPVDGVVTERALGPGEFRDDQAHILTVAELDPLRIETFLPIAMFGRVKVGDHAAIMPEAPVGGTFTATVTVVDHVLDAASGTIGVRLELPNPDLRLPAGIHCQVQF